MLDIDTDLALLSVAIALGWLLLWAWPRRCDDVDHPWSRYECGELDTDDKPDVNDEICNAG
jgi:hypothetical protein